MSDVKRISPGTCERLSRWHGGKGSATFYLLDMGYADVSTIKNAIGEVRDRIDKDIYSLSMTDKEDLTELVSSLNKLI